MAIAMIVMVRLPLGVATGKSSTGWRNPVPYNEIKDVEYLWLRQEVEFLPRNPFHNNEMKDTDNKSI